MFNGMKLTNKTDQELQAIQATHRQYLTAATFEARLTPIFSERRRLKREIDRELRVIDDIRRELRRRENLLTLAGIEAQLAAGVR